MNLGDYDATAIWIGPPMQWRTSINWSLIPSHPPKCSLRGRWGKGVEGDWISPKIEVSNWEEAQKYRWLILSGNPGINEWKLSKPRAFRVLLPRCETKTRVPVFTRLVDLSRRPLSTSTDVAQICLADSTQLIWHLQYGTGLILHLQYDSTDTNATYNMGHSWYGTSIWFNSADTNDTYNIGHSWYGTHNMGQKWGTVCKFIFFLWLLFEEFLEQRCDQKVDLKGIYHYFDMYVRLGF